MRVLFGILVLLGSALVVLGSYDFEALQAHKKDSRFPRNLDAFPEPGPVESLGEGWDATPASFAGLFELKRTNPGNALFFLAFEAEVSPETAPTILWLQGGPGAPGEMGALYEMGPFRLNADNKTFSKNPFAWTQKYNLIFADQPVGTGLSYLTNASNIPSTPETYAPQLLEGLCAFFVKFPQFSTELWVTGESYGGHWVPAFAATYLQSSNGSLCAELTAPPLQGVAVGNGFNGPTLQVQFSPVFEGGIGMVSQNWVPEMQSLAKDAQEAYDSGDMLAAWAGCGAVWGIALEQSGGVCRYNFAKVNVDENNPNSCYEMPGLEVLLNRVDIQTKLHAVPGTVFSDKGQAVFDALALDQPRDQSHWYQDTILSPAFDTRVMFYQGLYDPSFVRDGEETFALQLQWANTTSFQNASRYYWHAPDDPEQVSGYMRTDPSKRLVFAEVRGAGHVVPGDQPLRAWYLIDSFIQKTY